MCCAAGVIGGQQEGHLDRLWHPRTGMDRSSHMHVHLGPAHLRLRQRQRRHGTPRHLRFPHHAFGQPRRLRVHVDKREWHLQTCVTRGWARDLTTPSPSHTRTHTLRVGPCRRSLWESLVPALKKRCLRYRYQPATPSFFVAVHQRSLILHDRFSFPIPRIAKQLRNKLSAI